MPLPKRRHSATRRDKRRKNIHVNEVVFVADSKTGDLYKQHKAHWKGNSLFYHGEKIFSKSIKR
jgi:large subunit ribosomal protein L32